MKTEPTAGDGGVLAVTLMKASSCHYCRPTRAAPGETLGSGVPDRMMAAVQCRFSLGSIVCGVLCLELALVFPEEEGMMQQSSVSISLSF